MTDMEWKYFAEMADEASCCPAKDFGDRERTILAAFAELKERREDKSGLQSVCVECGPVTSCDEDGCCSSCGAQVAVGWFVEELWEELRRRTEVEG